MTAIEIKPHRWGWKVLFIATKYTPFLHPVNGPRVKGRLDL